MTKEQKTARKQSAESGHIRWIKDNCLRTKDGCDDYVFISYKSDDYEQVLDDIVYNVCKRYGLRVYFDTAFDEESDSWINQFYKNMCSKKCRAMIAFIDDSYFSSYATLIEMMARKTRKAGGDMKPDSLFFIPINIGDVTEIYNEQNTGLGTERFADKRINNQAKPELTLFNRLFTELADSDRQLRYIYTREGDYELYGEKTEDALEYGEMYLNVTECRELMKLVCPKDNGNDGGNKGFVEVIHDKLVNKGITSVFGETADKPPVTEPVKPGKDSEKEEKPGKDPDQGEKPRGEEPDQRNKPLGEKEPEGYVYMIAGKEYCADKREQGKIMYDAFAALTEKYPDKAEILTKRTSVAKVEDVVLPNTRDAKPSYFRICKKFTVKGQDYFVGISYGLEQKKGEVRGMLKLCGEDPASFIMIKEPEKNNRQ